jgi:hypothetical protein
MEQEALGERDLFGVRAIEKGFYGGVAQSAPTSAATSPQLSATSTIGDINGSPLSPSSSGDSIIPELSLSAPSLSPLLSNAKSVKALRLQPSDAEMSGRRNHDPAVYGPKPPSRPEAAPRSQLDPLANPGPNADMPHSPNHKIQSYAQWRLAADIRLAARAVPRSENRASGMRSGRGSINQDMQQRGGRRRSQSESSAGRTVLVHWRLRQKP